MSKLQPKADAAINGLAGLESLYDKVSAGGYVFVDDYGAMRECRAAVDDFRTRRSISAPLERADQIGYWKKPAGN